MPRLFDPHFLHASGAVIDWARLVDAQGNGGAAGVPAGKGQLQLRWSVSAGAGIPPEPFSVWLRAGQDKPVPVSPFTLLLDGYRAEVLPEAMLTLEVNATPGTPGQPMVLWAFGDVPGMDSINAVQSVTSSGPATLRVRAEGIWAFVLWQGSIDAVRGASVAAALADEWEMIEVAGLPVDGTWGGTSYSSAPQGLIGSPTDPATAAAGRLTRGLAPIGWAPFTQTGRPVPPWAPPNPVKYVEETQQSMLSQARPLFAAGVAPADQVSIQPTGPTPGPTTPSGTAPGDSTAGVPLQGVLLVAAASDPAAALALGFGTAYPLDGKPGVAERDMMITAHYKEGHLGDGTEEEFAAIVPWPAQMHTPPGASTGITAERAGLLTPEDPVSPWRETIRVNFDRVPRSLALDRPVAASFAVYPAAPGPAGLLIEPDMIAGGYHTLALSPRPEPNQDQIALVNSLATDLPLDLSARTLGHAVAVEDHFGLWSPWCDVSYTAGAPAYPIPQVVTARLDTSYAGSATCAATFAADVVVDWQIRQPQTLELRTVLCPIPYPGADLPPGVNPYAAAPPAAPDGTSRSRSAAISCCRPGRLCRSNTSLPTPRAPSTRTHRGSRPTCTAITETAGGTGSPSPARRWISRRARTTPSLCGPASRPLRRQRCGATCRPRPSSPTPAPRSRPRCRSWLRRPSRWGRCPMRRTVRTCRSRRAGSPGRQR